MSRVPTIEIVSVVALNVFTNILNKGMRTEIDFPKIPLMDTAERAAA